MNFETGTGPVRVQHLQGWTLVRLRTDLDSAASTELLAALAATSGPTVVDLAGHAVDDTVRQPLADAVLAAAGPDRAVVVVTARDAEREAFRGLGVEVHESLDDAVGDDATAVTRQEDHHEAPLAPSAADTTTVSAEDMLGR